MQALQFREICGWHIPAETGIPVGSAGEVVEKY